MPEEGSESRWGWISQDPWRWVLGVAGVILISILTRCAAVEIERIQLGESLLAAHEIEASPAIRRLQATVDALPREIRDELAGYVDQRIAAHLEDKHPSAGDARVQGELVDAVNALREEVRRLREEP